MTDAELAKIEEGLRDLKVRGTDYLQPEAEFGLKAIVELRELRSAAKALLQLSVGDYVYDVRDREMQGWEGPQVKAWGDACETFRRLCP